MKVCAAPLASESEQTIIHCHPPPRILVVDDDYETRQVSSFVLAAAGYAADTAEDGAAAWQALNTSHYDLLITNYKMPGISGMELIMKLHEIHMALPVIMASATLPRDQFHRYPWLKPAAMLLRPCTNPELLDIVKTVLCADRAAREAFAPSPVRKSHSLNEWFAAVMILLRRPAFR